MERDELVDFIERRLNSHAKALDGVVGSLTKSWGQFQIEINDNISRCIQSTVNGKIDKIYKEMTENNANHSESIQNLSDKIDVMRYELKPIIKLKNFIAFGRSIILWVAAPLAVTWAFLRYCFGLLK